MNTSPKQISYINSRSKAITNLSPGIIIGFDSNLKITGWNPQAVKVFGVSLPSAVGKPILDVISNRMIFDEDYKRLRKRRLALS